MVRSAHLSLTTEPVVIAASGGDGCQVYIRNQGSGSVYLGGDPNDVQFFSFTGGPTGGTFKLNLDSHDTADIAFDATWADVQAALEGLAAIQPGDVRVSGPDLPGGFMRVEFMGAYAGQDMSELTASDSLTGGSGETVEIRTIQDGSVSSSNGYELKNGETLTFELGPEDTLVGLSASTSTLDVLLTSASSA